jgi:hypothetical protein
MSGLSGALVRADLSAAFSRPSILRTYTYYLLAMSAIVFFWWPRGTLAASLRAGDAPITFAAAALGMFGCLAYLNARLGAEDYPGRESVGLREVLALAPVSAAGLVAGKLTAAALHTLFLLALGMPFLAAARGVSGVPLEAALEALLVAGCAALAFRSFGLLLYALLEQHPVVKDVLLLFCGLGLVFVPMLLAPAANPVSTLLALGGEGHGRTMGIPPVALSAAGSLAAALVFSGGALAVLLAARGKR